MQYLRRFYDQAYWAVRDASKGQPGMVLAIDAGEWYSLSKGNAWGYHLVRGDGQCSGGGGLQSEKSQKLITSKYGRADDGIAFHGLQAWQDFMLPPRYNRVAVDSHHYSMFNLDSLTKGYNQNLEWVCSRVGELRASNERHWTIVGEFTRTSSSWLIRKCGWGTGSGGSARAGSTTGFKPSRAEIEFGKVPAVCHTAKQVASRCIGPLVPGTCILTYSRTYRLR